MTAEELSVIISVDTSNFDAKMNQVQAKLNVAMGGANKASSSFDKLGSSFTKAGSSADGATKGVNNFGGALGKLTGFCDNVNNKIGNIIGKISGFSAGAGEGAASAGAMSSGIGALASSALGCITGIGMMSAAIGGLVSVGKQALGVLLNLADAASDLEESKNVVSVALPNYTEEVDEFSKGAGSQYGLNETQATQYASKFALMATNMGFVEEKASKMSIALSALTGDVSSLYNISSDEAYTKLTSVFTGETESLKELGVVMTQTNLDAYALASGFNKTTNDMNQSELVALRYSYVMNQLGQAQGDYARTADGWANATRTLGNQWESLKASLGSVVISILEPIVQGLSAIFQWIQVLIDAIGIILTPVTLVWNTLKALFGWLIDGFKTVIGWISSAIGAVKDFCNWVSTGFGLFASGQEEVEVDTIYTEGEEAALSDIDTTITVDTDTEDYSYIGTQMNDSAYFAERMAKSLSGGAGSTGSIASGLKKASKSADKIKQTFEGLMGFDEINNLSKINEKIADSNVGDTGSSTGGGSTGGGSIATPTTTKKNKYPSLTDFYRGEYNMAYKDAQNAATAVQNWAGKVATLTKKMEELDKNSPEYKQMKQQVNQVAQEFVQFAGGTDNAKKMLTKLKKAFPNDKEIQLLCDTLLPLIDELETVDLKESIKQVKKFLKALFGSNEEDEDDNTKSKYSKKDNSSGSGRGFGTGFEKAKKDVTDFVKAVLGADDSISNYTKSEQKLIKSTYGSGKAFKAAAKHLLVVKSNYHKTSFTAEELEEAEKELLNQLKTGNKLSKNNVKATKNQSKGYKELGNESKNLKKKLETAHTGIKALDKILNKKHSLKFNDGNIKKKFGKNGEVAKFIKNTIKEIGKKEVKVKTNTKNVKDIFSTSSKSGSIMKKITDFIKTAGKKVVKTSVAEPDKLKTIYSKSSSTSGSVLQRIKEVGDKAKQRVIKTGTAEPDKLRTIYSKSSSETGSILKRMKEVGDLAKKKIVKGKAQNPDNLSTIYSKSSSTNGSVLNRVTDVVNKANGKKISVGVNDNTNAIYNATRKQINEGIIDVFNNFHSIVNSSGKGWQKILNVYGAFAKIPHLATGGIVSKGTPALIGEAGKEAVLPLEHNTGWMDTLAATIANKISDSGNGTDKLDIVLNVGGTQFGRACINSINQAQKQSGRVLLNI